MALKMKNSLKVASLVLVLSLLCGCGGADVSTTKTDTDDKADTLTQDAGEQNDDSKDEDDLEDTLNTFPQLICEDYDLSKYDDGDMYFESRGTIWSLTDESAQKYPNLVAPLEEIGDAEKEYFEESIAEYDAEAKKFAQESRDAEDDAHYSCYASTGPLCADPKVVSLVRTEFTYFGGAHPDTTIEAFNLDAESGQHIPLSAVIKDKDGLNRILTEELKKQYSDHDFFDLEDSLSSMQMALPSYKADTATYVYAFNPNGLTFFFNPAILSPYADGGEQIDLTFEQLSSVLEDKYKQN